MNLTQAVLILMEQEHFWIDFYFRSSHNTGLKIDLFTKWIPLNETHFMTTTMEGILKHLYFSTIHHPLLKLVPSQDIDISEDGWFLFRDDVPSRHCVLFGRLEGGMSMILHIIVSMFTCVCIQFGTTIQNNKQCPQYKASGWFLFNKSLGQRCSDPFLWWSNQGPTRNHSSKCQRCMQANIPMYWQQLIIPS